MLSPSWPAASGSRRSTLPAAVRRRVAMAERRQLRRAVALGTWVMGGLGAIDVVANLVAGVPGALGLLPLELCLVVLALVAGILVRGARIAAEPIALAVLVAAFSVTVLGFALLPAGLLVGTAQLAILLLVVGLFVPWAWWWHLAGLAAAGLVTAAFVVSPVSAQLTISDRVGIALVVAMASVTSMVGHGLLGARARNMLEQQFALRHLSRYAQRQEAHVTELNHELNRVARRDSLTGIGNRLALDEAIARLLDQRGRLRPARFAIVLFDIDHFKAFNDEHGHLAGDAALGRLGEILRRVTRGDDLAFRYGGEEFLLLLPDVELTGAIRIAERVRLAAMDDQAAGLPPFTVSGGVALCDPADGRDPGPLLRRADAALYLAKRAGRNRIAADELSAAMQRESLATTS